MKYESNVGKQKITEQDLIAIKDRIRNQFTQDTLKINKKRKIFNFWSNFTIIFITLIILSGLTILVISENNKGNLESEWVYILVIFVFVIISYLSIFWTFKFHPPKWWIKIKDKLIYRFINFYNFRKDIFNDLFQKNDVNLKITKTLSQKDFQVYLKKLKTSRKIALKKLRIINFHPGYQIQVERDTLIDFFVINHLKNKAQAGKDQVTETYFLIVIKKIDLQVLTKNQQLISILDPKEYQIKKRTISNNDLLYWWDQYEFSHNLFAPKTKFKKINKQNLEQITREIINDFDIFNYFLSSLLKV